MDGFVDAQIRNSEILLELVNTYPTITTVFITVGVGLIVSLIVWAVIACLKDKPTD